MIKIYISYALYGNSNSYEIKEFSNMEKFVDWFLSNDTGNGSPNYSMNLGKTKHISIRRKQDFKYKETDFDQTYIRRDVRCNGSFGSPYLFDIMRIDIDGKTAFLNNSKHFNIEEKYCSDTLTKTFGQMIIDRENKDLNINELLD